MVTSRMDRCPLQVSKGRLIQPTFNPCSFQSQANAQAQKLAYVNDQGNAVVKVDNTTVGQRTLPCPADAFDVLLTCLFLAADITFGRNSVFMTSLAQIELGSLVLFDALHMPYGVSQNRHFRS